MKSSAELKMEAKQMLQGRWKDAVLMNLVPTLILLGLGALVFFLVLIPILGGMAIIESHSPGTVNEVANQVSASGSGDVNWTAQIGSQGGGLIGGLIGAFFTVSISWTFLETLRGQRDRFSVNDAFRGFSSPWTAGIAAIYLLTALFTTLWTFLLVIPGIVKAYSYSQANFIYKDIVDGTGQRPKFTDCITASRQLMNGYKGQLFWLDLSFIPWHILCWFTCGIGYLWLSPYISATKAAFYNNLPNEGTTF